LRRQRQFLLRDVEFAHVFDPFKRRFIIIALNSAADYPLFLFGEFSKPPRENR
jgi:hypothetical protein